MRSIDMQAKNRKANNEIIRTMPERSAGSIHNPMMNAAGSLFKFKSNQPMGSKSAAPCLQIGQIKSAGRVSPSYT